MHENYEIIARALEIAITLTKADDTWLHIDSNKNVIMDEPLFSTMRAIARILTDGTIMAVSGTPEVISGKNRRTDKS
ncbi:MAG: hypothetical protein LBV17_04045 [Treponema sp.]|jgi:hypothetical protein|nr:hypothetical protein [Treponema sp.]